MDNVKKYLSTACIFIIFVRPHLDVEAKLLYVFLGDVIFICFGILLIFLGINFRKCLTSEISIAAPLILIVPVFSILTKDISGYFSNYFRFPYFLFVYFIVSSIFHGGLISIGHLKRVILSVVLVNGLVVLIQLNEFPIFYDIVISLFGEEKLKGWSFGTPHIFGVFMNINWAGVSYSVVSSIIYFMYSRGYCSLTYLLSNIFILLLCVLLSGSLTGLIIFTTVSIYWSFIISFTLFNSLITVILLVLYYISADISTFKRLSTLYNVMFSTNSLENLPSLNVRVRYMYEALNYIRQSPIVGIGDTDLNPHNSFISLVLYFGLFSIPMLVSYSYLLLRGASEGLYAIISIIIIALLSFSTGQYLFSTHVTSTLVFSVSLFKYHNTIPLNNKRQYNI